MFIGYQRLLSSRLARGSTVAPGCLQTGRTFHGFDFAIRFHNFTFNSSIDKTTKTHTPLALLIASTGHYSIPGRGTQFILGTIIIVKYRSTAGAVEYSATKL